MKRLSLAMLLAVLLVACMVLPLYSCQDTQTAPVDDNEEEISELIEKVNELLTIVMPPDDEIPGAEADDQIPGAIYQTTNIQLNIIIMVVPGINASLGAFQDMNCTILMEEWTNVGNIAQGLTAHDVLHFYVKNTGEVDLTVHLSTGSTPFGSAWIGPADLEPIQTLDILVGEVQELVIIVSVNSDTEIGSHSFPIYIVGETIDA